MSATIYTTAAPSVRPATVPELQSIEAIIHSVRDGSHKKTVNRIRDTKDDTKRKQLKLDTLPVFYPTVRLGPNCRLDEDSEPTGIVQFDIDKKDNPGIDIAALRTKLTEHPACVYAFMSPSGGLKFGILTDFARASDEAIDITKQRFKVAYRMCLQAIQQHCGRLRFGDDPAVARLRQSCFLSHDPDAFFRADCTPVALNDQCHVSPPPPITETMADITSVQLVLDHIRDDLDYDARFQVNACVLFMLGRSGIPMLMGHWKTDQEKLARDLEDCLRGAKFGSLYLLQSYATKYGSYRPSTGGAVRRKVQPVPCDYPLTPLSTPAEATAELQAIIREFVTGKSSHFVNVTAGAGKTRTVLEALSREVSHSAKVLVLVPTHMLADDIVGTYKEIRAADVANADTLRGKVQRSTVVKFHSRKALCENHDARTTLEENGVSIPVQYCLSQCTFRGECQYTEQFNTMANIRVMTHNEWFNEQSAWFNGSRLTNNGSVEPNRDCAPWVPDYIVIDEDILKLGGVLTEAASARLPSVGLIIASVNAGSTLHDAVWQHCEQVLRDAAANQKPDMPSPDLSPAEYLDANRRSAADKRYSKIIAQLASYCQSDDPAFLDGMWVEEDTIKWLPLPAAAERYEGIPTLYMDATAHPAVVGRLLPGVRFHTLPVRQNEAIRLFQLLNKTITKGWLQEEPGNIPMLINGLKEIVKPYKKVGLITYKKIGKDDQFATTLAQAIGAEVWAHFGNLRGINTMEDVDCLLVVGRHSLRMNTMQDYARAIFGIDAKWETIYADLPVRMKDGSTVSLNTQIVKDPMHQAVYDHTSVAETLQAIGRGRPVHGSTKDIYVFSNENLSINTEVAEFFPFERYFEWPVSGPRQPAALVTADALERVRERGFIQLKAADLIEQLGLTAHQVKASEKKDQIADELIANGAARIDAEVRYQKGKTGPRTYLVFDMGKLEQALADRGERLIG
ncbi:BT4734/BF3469 family protein [Cupriavidus basilensis]|uniref:BT4734/BF3469 family protein n=1 Tax=Cupriavidus basilensis TaxID=68895 RepID=UPI0009E4FCD5|nr:BT4734/BF3469 family protein [Cupriavidus basilensis]